MTFYDPFRAQRRMSDLFEDQWMSNWDDTEMDLFEEDDNVIVKLKAPGFDEKNVDITVDANTLTITGKVEKSEEDENKKKKYYRKEISSRSFTRTVSLPTKVVSEQAKAKFKSGILTLTLPKAEEVKPKKINIEPEN